MRDTAVVGNHNDGLLVLFGRLFQQGDDLAAVLGVQIAGGLCYISTKRKPQQGYCLPGFSSLIIILTVLLHFLHFCTGLVFASPNGLQYPVLHTGHI